MTVSSNEAAYEQLHIGDDAAKSIIITITFCFVVASVAVSLRVTARRLRRLPLLTDDWLAMTSLVFHSPDPLEYQTLSLIHRPCRRFLLQVLWRM